METREIIEMYQCTGCVNGPFEDCRDKIECLEITQNDINEMD